jgi:hypothetical protein
MTWVKFYQNSVPEKFEPLVAVGEPVGVVGRVRESLQEVAPVVEPGVSDRIFKIMSPKIASYWRLGLKIGFQ